MEEFQAITIPFTMLATWMHEMLHALMAILVGFHFKYLSISLNGSGYALYYDPHKHHDEQQQDDIHPCDVKHAMIAMAGSFGPPCFGFLFFILSTRGKKVMQVALVLFASMILLSMYWIRGKETSELAYILLFGIATLLIWLACKAPQAAHLQTCLQFLAIQACIAVFEDVEYLFSKRVGKSGFSDTGAIADLMHWNHEIIAWSILGLNLLVLGVGFAYVYIKEKQQQQQGTILPLSG